MKITLYFINWNDSFYLPYIAKHYGKFCQKIVMYDNYSSDESRITAAKLGMDVRLFGKPNELNDQHYLDIKNHCWKEERGKANYVIVCDADEFILPDNLIGSIPSVKGYNMISESLPGKSMFEIKTGVEEPLYAKQALFDPNQITETNYGPGCHGHNMQGTLTTEGSYRLLHYRMIGGVNRLIERHQEYKKRLSEFNIVNQFGYQYQHTIEEKTKEWNDIISQANEIL